MINKKDYFNKIEWLIAHLLVFSIPFQARIILFSWGESFNEWRSSFLYATDVLLALLLLFWFIRFLAGDSKKIGGLRISDYLLIGFIIVSAISISGASIKGLALFRLIKLIEFSAIFWYFRSSISKIFELGTILKTIVWAGLIQAVVAVVQFILQSNIGYGLKYLGETILLPKMDGVATFLADGTLMMRSYGTTPHPNVLASFLLFSIFSFFIVYFYRDGIRPHIKDTWQYALLLIGFFLTFSRAPIAILFLAQFSHSWSMILFKKFWLSSVKMIPRVMTISLVTILTVIAFSLLFYPEVSSRLNLSRNEQAVTLRVQYNEIGAEAISKNLFTGVGIGNSVSYLMDQSQYSNFPEWMFQPVHNLYILVGMETGILGMILFISFIGMIIWEFIKETSLKKVYHISFLVMFLSLILISLFDHLFWTIQQGGLIFWLSASFLASYYRVKIPIKYSESGQAIS